MYDAVDVWCGLHICCFLLEGTGVIGLKLSPALLPTDHIPQRRL